MIIDRISHEVPYYRTYLKHAVLQGVTVVNNPFMWTADDKFFGASLATKLGVAHPKTLALPNKEYVPGIVPRREPAEPESIRSTGQAIVEYVGLPCILKDAHGGGWKEVYVCRTLDELIHHYDNSGLLTMIVQEFIEWEQFVRCLCLGQEEVLPMKYDPRERQYLVEHDHLSPELGARIVAGRADAGAGAGLRHELDRVRGARRRSLRHRLHEPGAGHGHQLADAALLRVGGAEWPTWRSAGARARPQAKEMRWHARFGGDVADSLPLGAAGDARRPAAGIRRDRDGRCVAAYHDLLTDDVAAESQAQLDDAAAAAAGCTSATGRSAPCCGRVHDARRSIALLQTGVAP